MTESSYHPLDPQGHTFDGTILYFPQQTFRVDSDPSHSTDAVAETHPGLRSNVFVAPLRAAQKRPSVSRRLSWRTIEPSLQMALFPLAAIAYIAFCYTIHGRVVPINAYGFYSVTQEHLATIKGGITSITVIIISIALYPVYVTISNLKSEEFFRVLEFRSHGVPLETINHISTPSFGGIDMMAAMWRHSCSNYYMLGIIASLLIWIVKTLAPGALTVDSVLADGELMAFAVGAVSAQSVLNGTVPALPIFNASLNSDTAAYIAWAEMQLNVQYSFDTQNTSDPDYVAYIAPPPLDLSSTTSARWLSDVIGINPTCSWPSTNLSTPVELPLNSSLAMDELYLTTVSLPGVDLDVRLDGGDLSSEYLSFAVIKDPNFYVTNHTTHASPSDGSTVFLLGMCHSGSRCAPAIVDITLDMSNLNTTFTLALTDQTWTMAILVCKPNTIIETREVRNDGYGVLSVQPLPAGLQLMRQGNLNTIQTTAMFSVVTMSLTQYSSSISGTKTILGLGSVLQGDMLFGKAQFDNLPAVDAPYGTVATISPAPIENITQEYIRILQSATKPYLTGYLGTAFVPGRISQPELVFAASIPNLAVATAGFAFLAALIIIAHFRRSKGFHFTLANLAAAFYGSELPAKFAQIMAEKNISVHQGMDARGEGDCGMDGTREGKECPPCDKQDVATMLAERRIFMQRRPDGSPVLHMVEE